MYFSGCEVLVTFMKIISVLKIVQKCTLLLGLRTNFFCSAAMWIEIHCELTLQKMLKQRNILVMQVKCMHKASTTLIRQVMKIVL